MNRGLPDRMKLRVIAADPPLDWAKVQSPADFRAVLSKRVVFGVGVIEREARFRCENRFGKSEDELGRNGVRTLGCETE